MTAIGTRTRAAGALLLAAVLGVTAGQLATSRRASGCDCSPHTWRVVLQSVTSSDPAMDHAAFWPLSGRLTSYEGVAHIWADWMTVGVIARVGAHR
jgi:hypothetical protein